MNTPFAFRPHGISALALLCALLGACSTAPKNSISTESLAPEQESPPVQETVTTATVVAPEQPAPPASAPPPVPPRAVAVPAQTTALPGAAAEAPQDLPEIGVTTIADDDVDRLKRRLAEEEAEINRLRDEQVVAQQLAQEEAAKRRALEATVATPQGQEIPPVVTSRAAAGAGSAVAAVGAIGDAAGTGSAQSAVERPLQHSVYFDYDSSVVGDEYDSMLIANAAYLRANPDISAQVQGNCDERGSREYNLALGARRAEAVKRALELAGADGRRIITVSFGAEKPVAFGQDEDSHRQNRRADILY